jgi:hypothetical protein
VSSGRSLGNFSDSKPWAPGTKIGDNDTGHKTFVRLQSLFNRADGRDLSRVSFQYEPKHFARVSIIFNNQG